jgi:hypothetical protein
VTGAEAVVNAGISDPQRQPLDGNGVLVGAVDTGIKQNDDLIHGTKKQAGHVEKHSAVWKVDQVYWTTARKPRASLKVLDQNGSGSVSAVITGLQDLADAVNMQGTVGVVNLSLGHPVTESYRTFSKHSLFRGALGNIPGEATPMPE